MRDHNFADAVAKSRESLIGWSTRSNKSSLTLTCRICTNYLQIMKKISLKVNQQWCYTKKKVVCLKQWTIYVPQQLHDQGKLVSQMLILK